MKILNNHLVFKYDHPEMIPLPKKIANGWVAVPHSIHSAMVLRSLGLDAPSPISSEYEWPGKYEPYAHQRKTAEEFTLNKRFHCLNGLGSGKSMSALWAADYLMQLGIVTRVLIVSPLSTLDTVWGREIFTNFPHRSYSVLHGTSDKRKQLLKEPKDFQIVNHHGVAVIADELKNRPDINLFILDESSFYRTSTNKSWKAMKALLTPDRWVWGMTGSPTPNAPTDAYGLARLVTPERTPFSFSRFKADTMLQVSPFRWVARKNAEQIVAKVLSPSVRFALEDCIELPPTIYHYRKVDLTPDQKHHYQKLLKECVTEIGSTQVTAVNAAVLYGRLLQCAAGVMYGTNKEVVKLDFSVRIKEVLEIIEEVGQKVIVFVPFTGALHAVTAELRKHGYACELVEGDTSPNERRRIFDEFQFGDKIQILCGQPTTMSHGLTLTASPCIIWFSPVPSNETYTQACHRIIRSGQKQKTNIFHIFSVKEEEKVYRNLQERKNFMDSVLEIVKNS